MLFNSFPFWIFLAAVVPTYWLLPFRAQTLFTLAASYFFYSWWNWRFLPLIAFSTVMDFRLGQLVASASSETTKRRYVWVSVTLNLLILGVFKYYNFFAAEFVSSLAAIGLHVSLPTAQLLLPVGISFYTFQSMSYVLDIARGVTKPAAGFWNFALYVAFFPHLVAGPIMRSGAKGHDQLGRGLLKQLESPRVRRENDLSLGLYYILIGLFKKVVIGDNMAALVDMVFDRNPSQLTGIECLVAIYAFAWQIYADFSGYSSIAQGVAKWMGIDLMDNFRVPYLAISPSDFWRRWHISLSTWLRDYLYIPLGGSRGRDYATLRNLMITMILGGLWHGANWTFIFWGLYHGILLCSYKLFGQDEDRPMSAFARGWRIVLMFHLICLGWLLFRAQNMEQVGTFLHLIATDWRVTPSAIAMFCLVGFYALPLFLFEYWCNTRSRDLQALVKGSWVARAAVYSYAALMLVFFQAPSSHEFIYFQF
jgi:alginate O-acetyltransferase complex protein AlgI